MRLGIKNEPSADDIEAMKHLGEILDKCREFVGGPLAANSIYRSPHLNTVIGGSSNSQHCKGEAADLDCDIFGIGRNDDLFHYIKDNLDFDQLIWEFVGQTGPAWVHVSRKRASQGPNRRETLIAFRENGVIKYKRY